MAHNLKVAGSNPALAILKMLKKEQIIEELKKVVDPELGLDVYTLGLIYEIKIKGKKVDIKMTLTSPMCPYGPQIIEEIKSRVGSINKEIEVQPILVFDPPWKISDEIRSILGI